MSNMQKGASFIKQENDKLKFKDNAFDINLLKGKVDEVVAKDELQYKTQLENYCSLFKLPTTEVLLTETHFSQITRSSNTHKYQGGRGVAYISSSFICLWKTHYTVSMQLDQGDMIIIIPFSLITKIKKGKSQISQEYSEFGGLGILPNQIIVQTQFTDTAFEVVHRNKVFDQLIQAVTEYKKISATRCSIDSSVLSIGERPNRFDPNVMADSYHFSKSFVNRNTKQLKQFNEHFKKHGRGLDMIYSESLISLVKNGIPLELKASLWLILSGATSIALTSDKNYYRSLCEKQDYNRKNLSTVDKGTAVIIDQIDKDLLRSLPEQLLFQKGGEGITALRNVLEAYALHNPQLGYCQSMNIVVATLLLFVEEEEAFYLICAIISKIPQYYISDMLGSITDMGLFGSLLKEFAPDLMDHFNRIGVEISVIALPWFLCLFINYVPWEVALTVIDCFCMLGPNVLLQVGLSMLMINKEKLKEMRDVVSVLEFLRTATYDPEELQKMAFGSFILDSKKMDDLRNTEKLKVIQQMVLSNQTNTTRDLARKTKFTTDQIKKFHDDFKAIVPVDSIDFCIRKTEFASLFLSHVPWWPETSQTEKHMERIFNLFDKLSSSVLSFMGYTMGIDMILSCRSQQQACSLSFEIHASGELLQKPEFLPALLVVVAIVEPTKKIEESKEKAHLLWTKLDKQTKVIDGNTVEGIDSAQFIKAVESWR
eukprot:TRINITY_DN1051_c0_g1_i2.p1 TRINITY_DN1051_c0_g1~~TRINITY_DN1051_c0_g1_i2.p1  ORF type:complete len:711 (+),score=103.31 TRINITY_DN1051_c0_g1_i2:512-2644(+)